MSASILVCIMALESGECRWIGREDIHVYCRAPAGRQALYSVVCPMAGLGPHSWVPAEAAALVVEKILADR